MKIISKFQDFYEFDCYRYGEPSPTPVWHRIEGEKMITVDDRIVEKINSLFLHKDYSIWFDHKGRYHHNGNSNYLGPINVDRQIIGIYPYTYYIPKVYFNKTIENDDPSTEDVSKTKKIQIHLSPEDCINILTIKDAYKEILPKYGVSYKDFSYPSSIINIGRKNLWYDENNNKNKIVEFKELFDIVSEPIIMIHDNIKGIIDKWRKYSINIHFNINISKTDLLSYYPEILTERDIYTELENYLISKYQEPILEPDNKTKITSHGFDLKTSFRKM